MKSVAQHSERSNVSLSTLPCHLLEKHSAKEIGSSEMIEMSLLIPFIFIIEAAGDYVKPVILASLCFYDMILEHCRALVSVLNAVFFMRHLRVCCSSARIF